MPTDNSPDTMKDLDTNNTSPIWDVKKIVSQGSLITPDEARLEFLEEQVAETEVREHPTRYERFLMIVAPKRAEQSLRSRIRSLMRHFEKNRRRLTDYPRIPPELMNQEENPPKDSQSD